MVRKKISLEIKQRLIDSHLQGQRYQATARILGIKRNTAYTPSSKDMYLVHGVAQKRREGARQVKMDEEMANAAVHIVESHPEFTLGQI